MIKQPITPRSNKLHIHRQLKPNNSLINSGIYFGQLGLTSLETQSHPLENALLLPSKRSYLKMQPITLRGIRQETEPTSIERQPQFHRLMFHNPIKIVRMAVQQDEELTQYKIVKIIYKGRYAIVYLGIDNNTQKKVAIKAYQKYQLQERRNKNIVKQEIGILRLLNHKNIVKLVQTITTPNAINIITEYVGEQCLRQYLKFKDYNLSDQELRFILIQIVDAISYMHNKDIVHRDIKLENIMFNNQQICLIDFGYSSKETQFSEQCGTLFYMAPEILQGKEYFGKPADMWALGILIYTLVQGTFPFEGKQTLDLLQKQQQKEKQFTTSKTISEEIQFLIENLLEGDPTLRLRIEEVRLVLNSQ